MASTDNIVASQTEKPTHMRKPISEPVSVQVAKGMTPSSSNDFSKDSKDSKKSSDIYRWLVTFDDGKTMRFKSREAFATHFNISDRASRYCTEREDYSKSKIGAVVTKTYCDQDGVPVQFVSGKKNKKPSEELGGMSGGWVRRLNEATQTFYYFRPETKEISQERPRGVVLNVASQYRKWGLSLKPSDPQRELYLKLAAYGGDIGAMTEVGMYDMVLKERGTPYMLFRIEQLIKENNFKQADTICQSIQHIIPLEHKDNFLYIMGTLCSKTDKFDEALQLFLNMKTPRVQTCEWIGEYYLREGNTLNAIKWFRSAIELGSEKAIEKYREAIADDIDVLVKRKRKESGFIDKKIKP